MVPLGTQEHLIEDGNGRQVLAGDRVEHEADVEDGGGPRFRVGRSGFRFEPENSGDGIENDQLDGSSIRYTSQLFGQKFEKFSLGKKCKEYSVLFET